MGILSSKLAWAWTANRAVLFPSQQPLGCFRRGAAGMGAAAWGSFYASLFLCALWGPVWSGQQMGKLAEKQLCAEAECDRKSSLPPVGCQPGLGEGAEGRSQVASLQGEALGGAPAQKTGQGTVTGWVVGGGGLVGQLMGQVKGACSIFLARVFLEAGVGALGFQQE